MTKPHPEGYEFDAPDGEWIGRLDDKQWGQNKNLILYFTDEGSGKRYWFSVFSTDGYRPRDKQINFKDEKVQNRYTMKTGRSSKGNPVFLAASPLATQCNGFSPHVEGKASITKEPTFNYSGGYVDQESLEAALDFLIAIEPDPESFSEECSRRDVNEFEEYQKIMQKYSAEIKHAENTLQEYGRQILPPSHEVMRDRFYEIVRSPKYQGSATALSIAYSSLNRAWRGINGWQP